MSAIHKRSHLVDTGWVKTNRPVWVILLVGLCAGLILQGSRGLWSPDEGRYVGAALQMLGSGNFLAPAYSPTELNFSKPPMTYWVIAASLKLFGNNTWAARIPYALSFGTTLALLFLFGRRVSPRKPWAPSLVYATSAFPFLTANVVSTDVLLTVFETLAVLGFVMATWPVHELPRRQGLRLMWLGFALAFLTKGPPGLLPLLPIVTFSVFCGDWRSVRRLFDPVGFVLFMVIGFSWYAMAALRYPWLIHYFLHDEVYGRIFTSMHGRHAGAIGWAQIYVPVLVVGTFPWWTAVSGALGEFFRPGRLRKLRNERSIQLFAALWLVIPLLIFCLSQSRLPLYLLPLFVPLALLSASRLETGFDIHSNRTRGLLLGWVILLLSIKGYAAYGLSAKDDNRRAAGEIASLTAGADYAAVIFLEDNLDSYAVEEQTPWGVRLYLDKPVYGVSARSPDAAAQLCAAIQAQGRALIVVNQALPATALETMTRSCRPTLHLVERWRSNELVLAQQPIL
ncbi:glycosyltransferase family 39 protein [Dyella solisilvae]|uniref:Glycosyltransferase family 39 protein n=1 Tax=Dyella solisilvae TaxID=1920168 RepID=A0A370K4I5_9GAMM|nr:glycosyltransferase family 39 protein [Dyella solisilvae]RDI97559.1 glycosyltransferase family 39 protein [Dyella solisilvae]